jgi:hypothetical protein
MDAVKAHKEKDALASAEVAKAKINKQRVLAAAGARKALDARLKQSLLKASSDLADVMRSLADVTKDALGDLRKAERLERLLAAVQAANDALLAGQGQAATAEVPLSSFPPFAFLFCASTSVFCVGCVLRYAGAAEPAVGGGGGAGRAAVPGDGGRAAGPRRHLGRGRLGDHPRQEVRRGRRRREVKIRHPEGRPRSR